ncbi:hypothetical protein THAOC_12038, partial [Thalassiosira oceanica]
MSNFDEAPSATRPFIPEDGSSPLESHPSIPESGSFILESVHGRKRRQERGISMEEFENAVRYGVRSRSDNNGKPGYMFKYDEGGITVITDESQTAEITSWTHPCWGLNLEKVHITEDMKRSHHQADQDSKRARHCWNSHAVAVVDQSGSMRKTDAEGGVTRSDLVWLCLAIDYIGRRLRTGEATQKDYFSLVLMGPTAKCVIHEHPMNWILYNTIIDMLRTRQPLNAGNYVPAINLAKELLLKNKHGGCLLQLLFLTDGVPSDRVPRNYGKPTEHYHAAEVSKHIASVARKFGSRLTIGAIAVGDGRYDALEAMIRTASDYSCHTFFHKSSLKACDMSYAFQEMSTLVLSSKFTITDVRTKQQLTYRDLDREPKSDVGIYNPTEEEWGRYFNVSKTVYNRYTGEWEQDYRIYNDHRATGLAVRTLIFGEGRERAVRRVREINERGQFVGQELVGKESLFIEDSRDSQSFHKTFCKVQQLAKKMAKRFNKRLLALPGIDKETAPIIKFLDCHVTILRRYQSGTKFLLVEKMLDHTKYKKWNTNAGDVNNQTSPSIEGRRFSNSADCPFTIGEIPQAFSHFTFIDSDRKFLICDLQGVLNTDTTPPVFELTDPAIHYAEMTNRQDFGRTDRGQQGIDDFLRSYKSQQLSNLL